MHARQRLKRRAPLVLIAHLHGHRARDAVGLGLVEHGVEDADAGHDEDFVFDGLELVQHFTVSVTSVVDEVNAVTQRLLHAGGRTGVHDDAFAAHGDFLGCRSDLGVGHPGRVRGRIRREGVAR